MQILFKKHMYITFVFSSVLFYEEWGFSHSNRFLKVTSISISAVELLSVINVQMISMCTFTLLVPWVLSELTYMSVHVFCT